MCGSWSISSLPVMSRFLKAGFNVLDLNLSLSIIVSDVTSYMSQTS